MATKKGGGSSSNGRKANPKYLGVKVGNGQAVTSGYIVVRQKGSKFHAGPGVKPGRDFTLNAVRAGNVKFYSRVGRKYVGVFPVENQISEYVDITSTVENNL